MANGKIQSSTTKAIKEIQLNISLIGTRKPSKNNLCIEKPITCSLGNGNIIKVY